MTKSDRLVIQLRELSRVNETLQCKVSQLANRLREQLLTICEETAQNHGKNLELANQGSQHRV
jgi:hypothetical protein